MKTIKNKWFCSCEKVPYSSGSFKPFADTQGHEEFFDKKELCWIKVCHIKKSVKKTPYSIID